MSVSICCWPGRQTERIWAGSGRLAGGKLAVFTIFLTVIFSIFGLLLLGILHGDVLIVVTHFRAVAMDSVLVVMAAGGLAVLIERLRD